MGDVESLNDVYKRADLFLQQLLDKHLTAKKPHKTEKVLIVTHGGYMTELIHALRFRFLKVEVPTFRYKEDFWFGKNCSIW